MTETIEEVVQEGVQVLDTLVELGELEDGWWDRINLDRFDMDNPSRCVLGQLKNFPHFYGVFNHYGLPIRAFLVTHGEQYLLKPWETAIIKLREERNVRPIDPEIDRLLAEEERIVDEVRRGPKPNAIIDFSYNDEPMSITFRSYPEDVVWKFQQIGNGAFAKAKITNIRFEEVA